MQNSKFIQEITADGSPTLRVYGENTAEGMHNAAGAATETVYIYGEAILEGQKLQTFDQTQYLVFGLGLGYIEMLIALLTNFKFSHIDSFEKEDALIVNFQKWLESSEECIYDKVYTSLIQKLEMQLEPEKFKKSLRAQNIQLQGEFCLGQTSEKYHVICYDAFSKKMNDSLWSYDFLNQFLKQHADQKCVFATYAKTGDLTRALKDNNFRLIERPGFGGKRDSTLAIRQG